MNELDCIRAATNQQTRACEPAVDSSVGRGERIPAALETLAKENDWLGDQSLVERVISQLEIFEPQSPEERATAAAIYMKIITPHAHTTTVPLHSVQVKISDQQSLDVPKGLLTAQSRVFQRQLRENSVIDLSGQASEATLRDFVLHLNTGKADFITNENATDLLFLARAYELRELTMSCLVHILDEDNGWTTATGGALKSLRENRRLLAALSDAIPYGIKTVKPTSGAVHISVLGRNQESWNCLKRLHDFVPITHLSVRGGARPEYLLDFVNHNPNIMSLMLNSAYELTDESFERLAHNLTSLRSLSICSSKITTIPRAISDRLIKLSADYCGSLLRIEMPNALEVDCGHCANLTHIEVPKATTLQCHNSSSLTQITSPATMLNCSECRVLASIDAPNAVDLDCQGCPALLKIVAPNARIVYSQRCISLISIDAPKALEIICSLCHALKEIHAPSAYKLSCTFSKSLEYLKTNATIINSSFCDTLVTIEAPCAEMLNCANCSFLASLTTSASKIDCRNCQSLSHIEAPYATHLDCFKCPSLTPEVKLRLFNTVRKNTLIAYYAEPDRLLEHIWALTHEAISVYGIKDIMDSPLHRWFNEALKLDFPQAFATEEEKQTFEQQVNIKLKELTALAASKNSTQHLDLGWFKNLKKLDNPQLQLSRTIWLGSLLADGATTETPLTDPDYYPILTAIGNQAVPFLQAGATRALLSAFHTSQHKQKALWKKLHGERLAHLLLPSLLLSRVNLGAEKTDKLLEQLKPKYYADYRVLNPILEVINMLTQDNSIPAPEREKILTLMLSAPERGKRENEKRFAERTSTFRDKQQEWIAACQGLFLFEHGRELIGVKDADDLVNRHKRVCQSIFGLKEEHHLTFMNTFRSQRYPYGLLTYAARLQRLPAKQKDLLTKLLGRFINGHLEGEFPANRYDLSVNHHLATVFKDSAALLEKWKAPLEINLTETQSQALDLDKARDDTIREQIKLALEQRHLGNEQETLYPTLTQVCGSDDHSAIETSITELTNQCKELRVQCNTAEADSQKHVLKKLRCLEIEVLCLKLLDPKTKTEVKINCLHALIKKLPSGLELVHNVHGMLNTLDTSKPSNTKWVKLQTTEHWEDFLLTGTEVNNSCQRINGDPHLNKCLLAYILDGKNQLMIVRDSDGKIAARSVLRILWNKKLNCPVLFMESIYTSAADLALKDLITKGCVEKAKLMGLCLVSCRGSASQERPYDGSLQALGGPAPFEYVDALRGIQDDGVFTIPASHILYSPDDWLPAALL